MFFQRNGIKPNPNQFFRFVFWVFLWMICFLGKTPLFSKEPTIKVRIFAGLKKVELFFPGGGWQLDERGRKIQTFSSGKKFSWVLGNKKNRQETFKFKGRQSFLIVNGSKYRGELQISFRPKGAVVINILGLEDYVAGVVAKEIGSLSPAEALKSQAVIVRTYAYYNTGRHKTNGFDLCNDVHCQVYGGMSGERATTNAAVKATQGIVMIGDGKLFTSLYHSTCGGMTSNNEDVFGGIPVKYLRRVKCSFCSKGNNYRWTKIISFQDLLKKLNQEGQNCRRIISSRVYSPTPLDRVTKIEFQTDQGVKSLKGTTFRRLFNLPSTTFLIKGAHSRKLFRATPAKKSIRKGRVPPFIEKLRLQVISDGPKTLVVCSRDGVKRVTKPSGGWMALTAVSSEIKPSGAEMNEASSSPSLDEKDLGEVILRKEKNDNLTIFGRGYGHQVGLCQSGTMELGKRGWSYRQILPYYYTAVSLRILKY